MCKTEGQKFGELRIAQAYVSLSSIPEGGEGVRIISLARFRNCEVRMFDVAQADSESAPLFWMELFDHDRQSAIDSCSCYSMEEGSAVFDQFISQAGRSHGESEDEGPSA